MDVITICGSLRKGSYNAALARAIPALAPASMRIEAGPSIGPIPHYDQDVMDVAVPTSVTAMVEAIRQADGVIIVSPEYNFSIPGPLKNAIDWASHVPNQPWAGKPVLLQSAATGMLGGSRMQYHLRQALNSLDARLLMRPELFVAFAAAKFDPATLALTDQATMDMVRQQLRGFEKLMHSIALLAER
jgi:chromate reductase